MREPHKHTKKLFREFLGLRENEHGCSKKLRYALKTKEHLIKKEHGGRGGNNIVYAHAYCNASRGNLNPSEQKKKMMELLEQGKHPLHKLNRELYT